ncbi:MAG: hypothetical protein H6671_01275 [Anaerolineaceae bacterium]|nr:hypothetical protein [Anaerolineaceae bacterium]
MPDKAIVHLPEIPTDDLPYWMRQARRGVDWGLLLVVGFCLVAVWPFIFRGGLPATNASRNFVYRSADYASAMAEGRLYPRWSPNVFGGYGAPIPNFYPPGGSYGAALLDVLFTGDPVSAVRLLHILAACVAGGMVYLFVSRRTTAAVGILASVVYVYQPYVGLTVPVIQGNLDMALALAWLPALLWGTDRLLRLNRPFDLALTAGFTALLFVTDVRLGGVGLLLAMALAVWQRRVQQRKARFAALFSAWALGVLLAGFFWIPALLEQDAIHWRSPALSAQYRLTVPDVLTPAYQLDRLELRPVPQFTVGLVGLAVMVGAGIGVMYFRRFARFETLFLAMGLVLLAVALVLMPGETWVLGPVSLCLAASSGALFWWGERLPPAQQRVLLPVLLIAAWMASLPVWTPPEWPETFGGTAPIDQIQYEQQGYGVAVLPPDAPVPATIPDTLSLSNYLIDGFRSGSVNKVAPGQILPAVQVGLLGHGTHSERLQIRTSTVASLTILTAYFPGWQAEVDNRTVTLLRDSDTGLIRVNVPVARSAELYISLGTTPIRSRAWTVSALAAGILLVLTWGRWRRQKPNYQDSELLPRPEARLTGVVLVAFCLITLLFAQRPSPLYSRPGYRLGDSVFINSRTNAGFSALAYEIIPAQAHQGGAVDVTIYWQAQRPLLANYQVKVYLLDLQDGTHWVETTLHHPGDYPTRLWLANRYVTDTYHLVIPETGESRSYGAAIEVFSCDPDCDPESRLIFFDNVGQTVGPVLVLPSPIVANR